MSEFEGKQTKRSKPTINVRRAGKWISRRRR